VSTLPQWLESDFACGRDGKRILPRWKQQGRVRVELGWLQEWYFIVGVLVAFIGFCTLVGLVYVVYLIHAMTGGDFR
jgi:hypothetical protein